MKNALRIGLVAALLAVGGVLAQPSFLGNIFQFHRQAEPLPTASLYQGGVLYNLDAGSLYFSNGTAWGPISSGGSGTSYWEDAGTGGIFNAPNNPQVRIGNPNFLAGDIASTQTPSLASAYVYRDGGYVMVITRALGALDAFDTAPKADPNGLGYQGANLYLVGRAFDAGVAFSQIAMTATGQTNTASTITHASTNAALGSVFPGLNLITSGPNMSFQVASLYSSSSPALLLAASGSGSAFNTASPVANSTLTIFSNNTNGLALSGSPTNAINVTATATNGLTISSNPTNGINLTGNPSTTGIRIGSTTTNSIQLINNSTRIDLGTGADDYFFSDGTRINTPQGLYASYYRVVGNTAATNLITTTTAGVGAIGFRQSDNQHYKAVTGRNFAPILSGPDWVYDGRIWTVETNFEVTACPSLRNVLTIATAGGGDTTVFCNDAATATASTGAGHPAQPYRNFVTGASAGDRSIFGAFTTSAPASGASQSPQAFASRQGGLVYAFRLRTGASNSTSNVTWYSGFFSSIPTSGSPYGNSVYVRFDTNNPLPSSTPDTVFRLCACNSGTCSCSNFSVAPANSTEYLFEVDCRESSTVCYGYLNGTYETSVSTNLPALSTAMGFAFAVENVNAAARSFGMGRVRARTE